MKHVVALISKNLLWATNKRWRCPFGCSPVICGKRPRICNNGGNEYRPSNRSWVRDLYAARNSLASMKSFSEIRAL